MRDLIRLLVGIVIQVARVKDLKKRDAIEVEKKKIIDQDQGQEIGGDIQEKRIRKKDLHGKGKADDGRGNCVVTKTAECLSNFFNNIIQSYMK